ncbi:MAG: hypothetical protein LBD29_11085 [Treponema sp.]|nr:hypothetical protein [Treponema sp.]
MKNMKNMVGLWLFLFITASVHSELLFNINGGWLIGTEKYKENSDSRFLQGFYGNLNFSFYPKNFFIGFFISDALQFTNLEVSSEQTDIGFGNSIALGPAFIWRISPRISTVFSLGPFYENYQRIHNAYDTQDSNKVTITDTLSATNIGLIGDVSVIFRTKKRFYFKTGLIGAWAFFRVQYKSQTIKDDSVSYTSTTTYPSETPGYYNLGFIPYVGVGWRFESIKFY